jgi:hypothetical protein
MEKKITITLIGLEELLKEQRYICGDVQKVSIEAQWDVINAPTPDISHLKEAGQGMRWVKASEPPKKEGDIVFIRYGLDRNNEFMYKDAAYYEEGYWRFAANDKRIDKLFIKNLEWLEESTELSGQQLTECYVPVSVEDEPPPLGQWIVCFFDNNLEKMHFFFNESGNLKIEYFTITHWLKKANNQ